jgi:hypothetical protein
MRSGAVVIGIETHGACVDIQTFDAAAERG